MPTIDLTPEELQLVIFALESDLDVVEFYEQRTGQLPPASLRAMVGVIEQEKAKLKALIQKLEEKVE